MSNASRLSELQDRRGSEKPRLQISQIIEEDPAPEFDSVGIELQAHRTRKGHEVEMVGRVLRIKPPHIIAIEENDYTALPGKTYAVGFVRAYAEYLGLNPDDCIRRFKLEYDAVMNPPCEEGEEQQTAKNNLAFPEIKNDRRLPTGSMVILGSILVLGVWGGWYLTTSAEREFSDVETVTAPPSEMPTADDAAAAMAQAATQQPEPAAAIVTDEPVDVATDAADEPIDETLTASAQEPVADDAASEDQGAVDAASIEVTARPELAPAINDVQPDITPAVAQGPRDPQVFGQQNFDARVTLRARANTWVRVEDAGGSVIFEENLQNGDSYMVPNRVGVIMATRNAGAVELLLDGQSLGPAGAVGQPVLETTLDASELSTRVPDRP